MSTKQDQASVKSEAQSVRDENVSDILFHPPPPKVGEDNPPVARCDFWANPYNGACRKESLHVPSIFI